MRVGAARRSASRPAAKRAPLSMEASSARLYRVHSLGSLGRRLPGRLQAGFLAGPGLAGLARPPVGGDGARGLPPAGGREDVAQAVAQVLERAGGERPAAAGPAPRSCGP